LLFNPISDDPLKYQHFSRVYYERKIDLAFIQKALLNETFNERQIRSLNQEATLPGLQDDINEIGYGIG